MKTNKMVGDLARNLPSDLKQDALKNGKAKIDQQWQSSGEKIGGYHCIEHKISTETALICIRGEIWPWDNNGNYKAVITNHHAANRLFRALKKDGRFRRGDEALLNFPEADLPKVIRSLGVITNLEIAKKRASNFNTLAYRPLAEFEVNGEEIAVIESEVVHE